MNGPEIVQPRPSAYTESIGEAICNRIAEGELLTDICKDPTMPHIRMVSRWLMDSREGGIVPESFMALYTKAREMSVIIREDEIIGISDDARNDWMDKQIGDDATIRVVDHEHIQRSKLRVDSRRWLLAKVAPHKYGDRLAHQMLDEKGQPTKPRLIVVVDGAPGDDILPK